MIYLILNSIRGLKRNLIQFLLICIILILSLTLQISVAASLQQCSESADDFFSTYGMADWTIEATSFDSSNLSKIKEIQGVKNAETYSRIDAKILTEESCYSCWMTGYTLPAENNVQKLFFKEGRCFDNSFDGTRFEAAIDLKFQLASGFSVGDTLQLEINNKHFQISIVGVYSSTNTMSYTRNIANIGEDGRFGIFAVSSDVINQLIRETACFATQFISLDLQDDVLKPQSFTNDTDLKNLFAETSMTEYKNQQMLDSVLDRVRSSIGETAIIREYSFESIQSFGEMFRRPENLRIISFFLPPIFYLIAVCFAFTMIQRIVLKNGRQIAVLKAHGFHNLRIATSFLFPVVLLSILCAFISIGISLPLSKYLTEMATSGTNPPILRTIAPNWQIISLYSIIAILIMTAAGIAGVWKVFRIRPADAMRGKISGHGSAKIVLEKIPFFWNHISVEWQYAIRMTRRNLSRFLLISFSCCCVIILFIISNALKDSVNAGLDDIFAGRNYDAIVRLEQFAVPEDATKVWSSIAIAEPLLEVPIQLEIQGEYTVDVLISCRQNSKLLNINTDTVVSEDGCYLNKNIAYRYHVEKGDTITLIYTANGKTSRKMISISGFVNTSSGTGSFISISQAQDLCGEAWANSVMLGEVDLNTVNEKLKTDDNADYLLTNTSQRTTLKRDIYVMVSFTDVMNMVGILLAYSIIFAVQLVSLGERKKEIAVLRMSGKSSLQITGLLGRETLLSVILGIAVGYPISYRLAEKFISLIHLNKTVIELPYSFNPMTFLSAGGLLAVSILASFITIYFFIRKISLPDETRSTE